MAVTQDEFCLKKFASFSFQSDKKKCRKILKKCCKKTTAQNPKVAKVPKLKWIKGFKALRPREQHYLMDYCRLYYKKLYQEHNKVLLEVCSWNPDPDKKLKRAEAKRCLYGTLGVMAPDILCLQETIWTPFNLLKEILRGEPDDKRYLFPRNYKVWWRRDVAMEAAILYDPAKLKVVSPVANEVALAWRERAESVQNGLGARTVALQGTIRSANTNIIIISIHMFHTGYPIWMKLAMTEAIISQAQEFANERNTTVILCGDWNCPVDNINIKKISGASMPRPVNCLGRNERDGIDSMIIINPEEDYHQDWDFDSYSDLIMDWVISAPEVPKLKLTKVKFFRWAGNVTADDMGGLDPRDIDKIYCGGGGHLPIIANLIFEN
jgi:exonuclease III